MCHLSQPLFLIITAPDFGRDLYINDILVLISWFPVNDTAPTFQLLLAQVSNTSNSISHIHIALHSQIGASSIGNWILVGWLNLLGSNLLCTT